jgi:hypothetical protein
VVESVKLLPTFIDIIRLGKERFYKDDVKLRVVSTITGGGCFYAQNEKELNTVLVGLVRNKTLPELRPGGEQVIEGSNKANYERLSKNLVPITLADPPKCALCNADKCTYCNSESDVLMKCPTCGKQYHECCSANYAWRYNIGLKYIFRCVECDQMIKLNEERVYLINGESKNTEGDESTQVLADSQLNKENTETWTPPQENKPIETPVHAQKTESSNNSSEKKTNEKNAPVQNSKSVPPTSTESSPLIKEKPKEETPAELRARRKSSGPTIRMCPICSSIIKPQENVCPKCQTRIK